MVARLTTAEARRLVREADASYVGINQTRWYSTVHPRVDGEATIRTWAVKTWRGKPFVLFAAAYGTDGRGCVTSGRCCVNPVYNIRIFNWVDYGARPHVRNPYLDDDRNLVFPAARHEFGRFVEFFGLGRFVNGFDGTRYQYCGWDEARRHLRVTDFIDLCRLSPRTELLVKAGLWKWLKPSYVRALAADRGLLSFVAKNRDALAETPPSAIISEWRRRGDKANVADVAARATLRRAGLSSLPIPPQRVARWLAAHGVEPRELRRHVDNLRELKMDLNYEPHILPHDWATYSLEVAKRVEDAREALERKEREAVREARREARETVADWTRRGLFGGGFEVVIPYSETELRREGNAMHNCIGTYWQNLKSGRCDLAFVRKDGKPYIDIDIRDGEVNDCRYKRNEAVTKRHDKSLCKLVATAFRRRSA